MGFDYNLKFEYKSLAERDTYFGKKSIMSEFFGTIFWIFLANRMDIMGSGDAVNGWGVGFNWGLSWIITKAMFEGDFNALTTMSRFFEEGNLLVGFINLLVQMVAGMVGAELYDLLGFGSDTDKFDVSIDKLAYPKWNEWANGAWTQHIILFVALFVYFKIKSAKNTAEPAWFFEIAALAIVFAIGAGGADGVQFMFAPNRVFSVKFAGDENGKNGAIDALTEFWVPYTTYLVWGWLAKFFVNLVDKVDMDMDPKELLPRFSQN